jgi:hypothetical protein
MEIAGQTGGEGNSAIGTRDKGRGTRVWVVDRSLSIKLKGAVKGLKPQLLPLYFILPCPLSLVP